MSISIILSMAGGLGLFLYGMRIMSDSIEKVAGAKLRGILERLTTNRFMAILVGVFFTAVIQSSSACTVMVVSFVNSGLMTLTQAAGVILGANVGTTVTALLVSFKLEKAAPVILLAGVLILMFVKKQKISRWGEAIIGFGVLFMGLSSMSGAMSGMKDSPEILHMFASLQSPLMAVLLGTVLTAVIQSSSVTVSILVLLANQGMMGIDICMFTILGCNIGSCATAMIASLSGKKDAKRAAAIHLIFNVIGTVIVFLVLLATVDTFAAALMAFTGNNPGRVVAYAHISIKIFQVVLLMPFIRQIVKLTYVLVPGDDKKIGYRDSYQLKYIGEKVVLNPATAVVEVIKELDRMGSLANENLNRAMNALITLDDEEIGEVYEVEKNIDFLSHAITNYLVKINQTTLPIEDLKSIGALFHVVNDIERIGDHAENIVDAAVQREKTGVAFSKAAQRELGEMIDMVNTLLRFSFEMFVKSTEEHVEDIRNLEEAIDEKEKELQQRHIERLSNNECTPEAGAMFSDIVSGLERVADHATNIAFANSYFEPN
ncbi:MAG: Na/Pi cotransporter family protein [Lachnospiraceae bacterium]|jgi:phosphate:Na+ symporter|nr:Na/Pi cotransporter family protein [Lachnospiraceae bacterium]MCI9396844.1 Na/Pi cotransporter family protein [Lachnospiraceae bacterium]